MCLISNLNFISHNWPKPKKVFKFPNTFVWQKAFFQMTYFIFIFIWAKLFWNFISLCSTDKLIKIGDTFFWANLSDGLRKMVTKNQYLLNKRKWYLETHMLCGNIEIYRFMVIWDKIFTSVNFSKQKLAKSVISLSSYVLSNTFNEPSFL